MTATFSEAPAVRAIGEALIAQYHRHLIDCEVRVDFLFRSDVPKKGGKEILGQARKIGSLAAFLADPDADDFSGRGAPFFVIVISEPWWELLTETQRVALVDHELSHAWCEFEEDENGAPTTGVKLSLLAHDVEEFSAIVRRYGLWKSDLKSFGETVRASDPQLDFGGMI